MDLGPHMPTQIVTLTAGDDNELQLALDHDTLASIFAPAADKHVQLISICGPARHGRSFLVNFILRYLQSLEQNVDDFLGWDKPNDALTGFEWGHGDERKTLGIWITKKPFFFRNSTNGQEVAVYLMDTQGVLDEFSSAAQTQFILELCLRVSTMLIFSSAYDMQEDKLLALADAVTTATNSRCDRIYWVIRDWSKPELYQVGETGGQLYKEKKLQVQSHHSQASKAARQVLRSKVEKIDCFLLPPPGANSQKSEYDGNLTSLNTRFTGALEPFLLSVLTEDKLCSGTTGRRTGADLIGLFEEHVLASQGFECALNQLSIEEPEPSTATSTPSVSDEDPMKELYLSLVQEYASKLEAKVEAAHHKFLNPASFDALHAELKEIAFEKYTNCNLQANRATFLKYDQLLSTRIDELRAECKKVNDGRRKSCFGKWEGVVKRSEEIYHQDVKKLFKNGVPALATKEQLMKTRLMRETRECFDMLEGVDVHDPLYGIYAQTLTERMEEIFAEEKAAAKRREQEKREQQFEACKAIAVEQYDLQMVTLARESGAAVSSEDKLKSFHATAVQRVRAAATADLPEDDEDGGYSFENQLLTCLNARFEDLLAQNNMKRADFMDKKQEWLEPAVKAYKTYFSNWKEEQGNAVAALENFHQASSHAKEEATAVLKAKTLHVQDEELTTQLFTELNAVVEQARGEELAELEEFRNRWLNERQQQTETLIAMYKEKMSSGFKNIQLPTPERLRALHDTTLQEILDVINNTADEEFKTELEQKFRGEPFEEFNRKAINQVKARKHEAEHFMKQAVVQYQTSVQAIDLKNCSSIQAFDEKHEQLLEAVTKQFKESNEVTDEAFLQPYVRDLAAKVAECYEKKKEGFEVQLEKEKARVHTQTAHASKEYEKRMKNHFKKNAFMRPHAFRLESDHIMARLVKEFGSTLSEHGRRALRDGLEALYPGFEELNTMNTPSEQIAIGIDLGTTYSCVAVYLKGEVQIVPSPIGGNTVPSYVGFTPQGELVGEAAKNQAHENPVDTIFDAKRLIGRDFKDPVVQADMKLWPFKVVEKVGIGKPTVMAAGVQKDPELISAKVLKHLKKMAEAHLQLTDIKKAVITVPAYFNDGQRQATKDAGDIAGLEVLQIINEPTAAAMAYYLHSESSDRHDSAKKNILVYDLGGGTFDVSILEVQKGNLEVKAVNGDTHLGGEDFDQAMVEFCIQKFKEKTGVDIAKYKGSLVVADQVAVARQLRRIRNECERRKKDLSEAEHTTIAVDEVYGHDINVKMTRAEFEEMNRAKFELTIDIVRKALKDAKLTAEQIDEIVLVGGSTRIPKIQQLLTDFFGGRALYMAMNPDEAVARGAAILAAKFNGEAEQEVMRTDFKDVTPLSLGVRLYDGGHSVIIPRNTPIPVKLSKNYYTVEDYQTSIKFKTYEGEDPVAENNHFLGSFTLSGIPSARQGVERTETTMEITEEGILRVTAVCASTGGSNNIEIKTEKGRLSQEAIAELRELVAAE